MFEQLRALWSRRRPLEVWHHPEYRLPLASAESTVGLETRRADDALFYLLKCGALKPEQVHVPAPVSFEALLRVHSTAYIESLTDPHTLASIFAVDAAEVEVDTLLGAIRLGCGGTVEAAQRTLSTGIPTLNLLGGFHHAGRARGGGFCAVNDLAVAVATLRAEGFAGKVAILDLDAHPPDGTSDCFLGDEAVWIGSLDGASWGKLANVDETSLPGCEDGPYLAALEALLGRMPKAAITFVLAGGDVVAGDRLGRLKLTLGGARKRDLLVAQHLEAQPQVWLPAGGYGSHAWKVLAGTGIVLGLHTEAPIPPGYDPLAARFKGVAAALAPGALGSEPLITEEDVAEIFGHGRQGAKKVLGFYTAEGLEYALEAYGLLPLIRRLGYSQLHVEIENLGTADRSRLFGKDSKSGERVTLIELEVERKGLAGGNFLFVNWLSLRNPRAHFSPLRPQLPGQEVPGLGLAREMSQMLALMAKRLVLDGVAFRPSWYHMAYAARHTGRFVTAARQGRFEALVAALKGMPLLDATRAVAEGRVRLDGQPYSWEPEEMVEWLSETHRSADAAQIAAEKERCHFTVEATAASPSA